MLTIRRTRRSRCSPDQVTFDWDSLGVLCRARKRKPRRKGIRQQAVWQLCEGCREYKRTEQGWCWSCRPTTTVSRGMLKRRSGKLSDHEEAERQAHLEIYQRQYAATKRLTFLEPSNN